MAQLPKVLGALIADVSHLALLDLSFNKLSRIEPALGTLTSLEMIRLHTNRLEHIEDLARYAPFLPATSPSPLPASCRPRPARGLPESAAQSTFSFS